MIFLIFFSWVKEGVRKIDRVKMKEEDKKNVRED